MATIDINVGKIWCNNSDMAFSLFEILTRDIHIPSPTPTPPQGGPHNVQLKHDIINIDWMIIY